MNKFKTGDLVKMKENHYRTGKREIYTVENCYSLGTMTVEGEEGIWDQSDFELLKANKPEFCMKTQPWFIRVNNEEEFEIAKEFLENKGFTFDPKVDGYCEKYGYLCLVHNNKNLFTQTNLIVPGEQEIKLIYKKVLDKVEYPEVKSEQQLEIEKIEEEMRKLADRLNSLKSQ